MKMLIAIAAVSLALGLTGQSHGADQVIKKSVKVIPKTTAVMPGLDRMLNPQPLPPRWLSSYSTLNPLIRRGLNPQPLPPGPPDPDVLRAIRVVPRVVR